MALDRWRTKSGERTWLEVKLCPEAEQVHSHRVYGHKIYFRDAQPAILSAKRFLPSAGVAF